MARVHYTTRCQSKNQKALLITLKMQEIDSVIFSIHWTKKNIPYHPKYMYIWGDDILNI